MHHRGLRALGWQFVWRVESCAVEEALVTGNDAVAKRVVVLQSTPLSTCASIGTVHTSTCSGFNQARNSGPIESTGMPDWNSFSRGRVERWPFGQRGMWYKGQREGRELTAWH
jgi:hypothetical protein